MKIYRNFAALALAGALVALPAAAQGKGRGHSTSGMGMSGMSGMTGMSTQVTKSNGVLTNPAGSHTIGRSLTRTNTEGNKTLTITKTAHGRATHTLTHTKKMKSKRMKSRH
jgi:hypothetical protein